MDNRWSGARAESLRFTDEKTLSIRARCRYSRRGNARRISAGTPRIRQAFFPRFAGFTLRVNRPGQNSPELAL
jgi:hypothetical protein